MRESGNGSCKAIASGLLYVPRDAHIRPVGVCLHLVPDLYRCGDLREDQVAAQAVYRALAHHF